MERTMENTISTLEEITREDGKLSMELRAKVDRFKELFVELNMMSKMPSMENTISDLEEETKEHEKISTDFKAELDRVKESLVKPNNTPSLENTVSSFEKLARKHRKLLIKLTPKVDSLTERLVKLKNINKEQPPPPPPPSEANFRFVLKQAKIIKTGKRHVSVGKDGLIDTLEIPLDGSVKIFAKGDDSNFITGEDLKNAIPYLSEHLKGLPLEQNCRKQGQDTSDQE